MEKYLCQISQSKITMMKSRTSIQEKQLFEYTIERVKIGRKWKKPTFERGQVKLVRTSSVIICCGELSGLLVAGVAKKTQPILLFTGASYTATCLTYGKH